uniref:Smp_203030 n=2 Tax=Schistosoma mansoni TaxID=6183 RepID=G4VME9_SCHMA
MHNHLCIILLVLITIMGFNYINGIPSIYSTCANLTQRCEPTYPCCSPNLCQVISSEIGTCVECFQLEVDCQYNQQCCSGLCFKNVCTMLSPN